jgi:hypothetical protein
LLVPQSIAIKPVTLPDSDHPQVFCRQETPHRIRRGVSGSTCSCCAQKVPSCRSVPGQRVVTGNSTNQYHLAA